MCCFGGVRYAMRMVYDTVSFSIVKKIARVPASENNLSWKIGGPGISRAYYY